MPSIYCTYTDYEGGFFLCLVLVLFFSKGEKNKVEKLNYLKIWWFLVPLFTICSLTDYISSWISTLLLCQLQKSVSVGDGIIYCIMIRLMFFMFLIFLESFPCCYFLRFQSRGWQRCLHEGASRQPQGQLCPPSIALTNTKGCSEIRRNKCIRRCHIKCDEIIKNGVSKAIFISSLFFFQGGINRSIHNAKWHGETGLLLGTTYETDKWQRQGKKQGLSRLCTTCSLVVYQVFLHGE